MSIEQLQMILSTLGTATESAAILGYLWLALDLLGMLIGAAVFLGALVLVGRLIQSIQLDMEFHKSLQQAANLYPDGRLTPGEKAIILKQLQRKSV